MDEEEEEIERNISDSKEGVDDRNDSAEQVGITNDSRILVVGGSDPKSDPSETNRTTNGTAATGTTNGISTRKLYPLFINLVALVLFGDVPKWSGQGNFEETSRTHTGRVQDMSGR